MTKIFTTTEQWEYMKRRTTNSLALPIYISMQTPADFPADRIGHLHPHHTPLGAFWGKSEVGYVHKGSRPSPPPMKDKCDWLQQCPKYVPIDFPGGPVVTNLTASAGDMDSIPGPRRFHLPRQLSTSTTASWSPHAVAWVPHREATAMRPMHHA